MNNNLDIRKGQAFHKEGVEEHNYKSNASTLDVELHNIQPMSPGYLLMFTKISAENL